MSVKRIYTATQALTVRVPFTCPTCGHQAVATAKSEGEGRAESYGYATYQHKRDEAAQQAALKAELAAREWIRIASCPACGRRPDAQKYVGTRAFETAFFIGAPLVAYLVFADNPVVRIYATIAAPIFLWICIRRWWPMIRSNSKVVFITEAEAIAEDRAQQVQQALAQAAQATPFAQDPFMQALARARRPESKYDDLVQQLMAARPPSPPSPIAAPTMPIVAKETPVAVREPLVTNPFADAGGGFGEGANGGAAATVLAQPAIRLGATIESWVAEAGGNAAMKGYRTRLATAAVGWEDQRRPSSKLWPLEQAASTHLWAHGRTLPEPLRAFVSASWQAVESRYDAFLARRSSCKRCSTSYRVENLSLCVACDAHLCPSCSGTCSCGGETVG